MDAAFSTVEDLFQDENGLRVSHRKVDARIDDLRRVGCNQKIAWSKLGCIAIIDTAGTGVETRHLACNPEDGQWVLSDAYPIANVTRHHEGKQLQHVVWSSPGAELAVIDVLGRVSFHTVFLAVNQLTLATMHTVEVDDDLNAIVGFWWLPIERPYSISKSATKGEDNAFKYNAPNFRAFGPFHPVAHKAAALGITRGGTAKLWYHDATQKYQETSTELEALTSLEDLISHASISWNKDHVAVIATYTMSRRLRVYRVAINWNVPVSQNKMPPQFPTSATLVVKRVKTEDSLCPTDSRTHDISRAQLSHLEVLGPQTAQLTPSILAVFSGKTAEGIFYSVIARWDIKSSPSILHPSFDQLGVRRASISSPTGTDFELHRLDDVTMDKCVVSLLPVTSSSVIALSFSDGSLDFRDRYTFRSLSSEPFSKNTVTSMFQAGFNFLQGGSCVDLVLSPNNTVALRLDPDSEVHMMAMDYTRASMTDKDSTQIGCVALALQHAYSCSNFLNNDDLLLVARKYRSNVFNITFLTEVHRALNLKMDFAAESPSERLIRNPLLQRCLSLQYALDFKGERVTKTLSGKLAWATLHLRVASLAFGATLSTPPRPPVQPGKPPGGGVSEIDLRPEALQTLMGLVRWFMDMMSLIISDLFELAKATRGNMKDVRFLRQKVLESNSPALFLTLASAPRAFLRYNCRSLRSLESHVNKQIHSPTTNEEQRMTFKSFKVPIESSAIKIQQFERVMLDIDGVIRAAYHDLPEQDRAAAERILFVNNDIPPIFQPSIERLLSITLPNLRKDLNVATLFWTDVTWLGFHDDVGSREWHRTHRVDALRKVVLPQVGKLRLRRCTRCCSVVEEVPFNKSYWLGSMQRMCLCGTLWMHLSPQQGAGSVA